MLSNPIKRQFEGQGVEFFIDEFLTIWIKVITIPDFDDDWLLDINTRHWKIATINNEEMNLISITGINILFRMGLFTDYSFTWWINKQRVNGWDLFNWLRYADKGHFKKPSKKSKEFLADMMGLHVDDIWPR